ncbi:PH domain-containing protein [Pseudonocardia acaciae]|uniref:PH domain-containing protein n=1 Tax=Pseudonocardia acaciae TaxID=551276 RepID=UPI000491D4EB|nr:PH domain-containing protein [Pseudonocardia acaciae]
MTAADRPEWRRLDPRMLAVFPLKVAGGLIPVLAVLVITGQGDGGWRLLGALGTPAVLVVVGAVRWYTVRYRVGAERVELRSGLLARQQRSLRRDRVRTVDLRASPVHRLFGLSVVEIGTGSTAAKEGRLSLDAVSSAEGERLRRELLDRTSGPHPAASTPTPSTDEGATVAQLDLAWLRFAPLTTSGLVAVGAVVGTAFKIAGDAGLNPVDLALAAGGPLTRAPLWLAITLLTAAVLVVAALGSLAVYLEGWWRYRLTREADGTLRLRRGLLTTRSLSIEQRRMRGAEVSEPLALRLAAGARCTALTTGLDTGTSGGGALLPPAPRSHAHRVAAAALLLDDPANATAAPLVRHPPAALRRRLTRATLPALALALAAWLLRDELPVWPSALLAVPVAALLGADRYRNLGHALRREYLVIGSGSLVRRRVAVSRRGIIGWRLRQSPFQRWAGVVTLDAVTAAGAGHYSVVDISPARAVELVEQINPALLVNPSGPTGERVGQPLQRG